MATAKKDLWLTIWDNGEPYKDRSIYFVESPSWVLEVEAWSLMKIANSDAKRLGNVRVYGKWEGPVHTLREVLRIEGVGHFFQSAATTEIVGVGGPKTGSAVERSVIRARAAAERHLARYERLMAKLPEPRKARGSK